MGVTMAKSTCLVGALRLAQLAVQEIDRLLNLPNFLHKAMIDWVTAHLHVRPVRARFQPRLRDLMMRKEARISMRPVSRR